MKISNNTQFRVANNGKKYVVIEAKYMHELLSLIIDNKDNFTFSFYNVENKDYLTINIDRDFCKQFYLYKKKELYDAVELCKFYDEYVYKHNLHSLIIYAFVR